MDGDNGLKLLKDKSGAFIMLQTSSIDYSFNY